MILSEACPFLLNRLMAFIFTQASIWILGAYTTQRTVDLYGAAAYLVNLVSISLFVVSAVALPFIVEQTAQNQHKRLEQTLRTMTTLAAVPALIGLSFFVVFGRSILELVYKVITTRQRQQS